MEIDGDLLILRTGDLTAIWNVTVISTEMYFVIRCTQDALELLE